MILADAKFMLHLSLKKNYQCNIKLVAVLLLAISLFAFSPVYSRDETITLNQKQVGVHQDGFCGEIRKKYAAQLSEMEKTRSSSDPKVDGWFLGAGVKHVQTGCLTYENRYRAYQTPTLSNEKLIECNSLLDKNATAFGIRISQNQVFSNDFQNFIRSVITEVGWIAGVDVVLLYFVDGDKNSVVPTNIPEEFQPLLRIHDRFDIVTEFPTEAVVFDGVFQQAGYPAIGVFGHMSGLWFMKKNPQYEFMWIIESDVRSTGSWARILDHLGTNQDFMTTYPIEKTDPTWVWKSPKFDQDDLYNGLQVFYGTSKSFAAIAYRELELGNNAFLEQFLPSVAKKNNMTTSYTALPVYGKVELTEWINELFVYNKRKMPSWAIVKGTESHLFEVGSTFVNFGGAAAQPFYEHWITEPSFCPTTAIIHPIKM